MNPTFQGEVMLLGWSESHNGGAKVTFQLADPSDLEPFKAMTVAKGKTAGQRLACVLVEIGDDEQPVERHEEKPKGGTLAKLAGMWCNDPRFWEWLTKCCDRPCSKTGDAAHWIRQWCSVNSRTELDSDEEAAARFHSRIREPFSAYLKTLGEPPAEVHGRRAA